MFLKTRQGTAIHNNIANWAQSLPNCSRYLPPDKRGVFYDSEIPKYTTQVTHVALCIVVTFQTYILRVHDNGNHGGD